MQGGRPVCYHSKFVNEAVLDYPMHDKYLSTIIQAIKK
jgi:hypothetical protein